jgi:hypothetical protein
VLPELALDTVAAGMSNPLFVTAPPGDRARLFVVERTGQIRIIKNGTSGDPVSRHYDPAVLRPRAGYPRHGVSP